MLFREMNKVLIGTLCVLGPAAPGRVESQESQRSTAATRPQPGPDARIRLNHVVYIIQENITFDHYFGSFPGADGIPKGTKLPYRPGGPPEQAPSISMPPSFPET